MSAWHVVVESVATVACMLITLGVQLRVSRDGRDATRRAGLSASVVTCSNYDSTVRNRTTRGGLASTTAERVQLR